LEKAGLFVFPHMVDMVLDVSEPLDVFYKGLSNSAKADVRKVGKQGYSYEVFSDARWLRFFYDAMYVPLIESRFVDSPLFTPPFLFFRLLNMMGYQLLLVKDVSGTFVSGCFFYVRKNELFSRYNGVLNGDFGLIRNGAESAFYYFLIDWAKKQGLNRIDLGYCRSFLNDGVFQYKRKWGAEMRKSDGTHLPDVFGIKVIRQKGSLCVFLKKNPFFGIDRGGNFIEFDVGGDD
jgi:hypothetical protein